MFRLGRRKPDLKTALARLQKDGLTESQVSTVRRYVEEAHDRELYKVNPRYAADRLQTEAREMLGIFAHAVHGGVFDLNWDIHCPHCGELTHTFESLQNARDSEYCPHCRVDFAVHLDHEAHVTFTVNEAVKRLPPGADDPDFRTEVDRRYGPVTGLELINVPAFRQLFAGQVLPSHESLKVKRVALIFTDLMGSTALYARRGDPRAYTLVREHFDVLFDAAGRRNGVVVKTIGDAVMASFVTPADGLRAALSFQQDIAAFNRQRQLSDDECLILRLGLHAGPCISVTLNGRLDYFGTTVNVAARVEALSRGGDVVVTDAVWQDDEVRAVVPPGTTVETIETRLRGFDERFVVHRLSLPDSGEV